MAEFEIWQTVLLVFGFVLVLILGVVLYWVTSDQFKIRQEQIKLGYKVPTCMSYIKWCCTCCLGPYYRTKWEREHLLYRSDDYGDEQEQWQSLLKMPPEEQRALSSNTHCRWAQLPRGDLSASGKKKSQLAIRRIRALVIAEILDSAVATALTDMMASAERDRMDERRIERIRAVAARWKGKIPARPTSGTTPADFDVDSESSEDDWDMGMEGANVGGLDFLTFIPTKRQSDPNAGVFVQRGIPSLHVSTQPTANSGGQPRQERQTRVSFETADEDNADTNWDGAQAWGQDVVQLTSVGNGNDKHHQIIRKTPAGIPPKLPSAASSVPMSVAALKTLSRTMTPQSVHEELQSIPLNAPGRDLLSVSSEPLVADFRCIPFAHNRVHLEPLSWNPSQQEQYINASYISGPTGEPQKYILTQLPLSGREPGKLETVTHFWRMMWSNRSNVVVVVNPVGRPFWPSENQHIQAGDCNIALREHIRRHDFDVVWVDLTKDATKRKAQLYLFNRWPPGGAPEPAPLLGMLHEVAVFSSNHPGGPMIVMDEPGGDRGGAVIALEHLIYQIETKNQVDVVKLVRSLREERGGLFADPSFYVMLHKLATMYTLAIGYQEPSSKKGDSKGLPPAYVPAPQDDADDV